MHALIATTGALSPGPVAAFASRLVGEGGRVSVITVIEVPRSFLNALRSESWHPLDDGEEPTWTAEEDLLIARYVEERGRKHTEPLLAALAADGIETEALYLEGADAANVISQTANALGVDIVILGATRMIFESGAWESVSARVMVESGRPVLVVPAPVKELMLDGAEVD